MNRKLNEVLAGIKPVDESHGPAIQARLDNLTKPLGSLGCLEELAKRYCLITARTGQRFKVKQGAER
jgi:nicotinate-nucleotide--dimethylbenzimidazole phosphoribosyltransferase